MEPRPKQLP